MITVRPYNKKDFRYVQDICLATSWLAEEDTPTNRAMLCAMFCDYYLDNQGEFCFVAVDDNDVPVGYILCSADCDDYHDKMTELYLPLVRKISGTQFFKWNAEVKLQERYSRQGYTAHLHVDILPDFQHQGVGTQLIQSLEKHLKEKFVEGIYLICGSKNESARAFYEKNGYEDIDYITGAVVYGKKLFVED